MTIQSWLRNSILLCGCIAAFVGAAQKAAAQPEICIVWVEPDVRGQQVRIGAEIREIKLAAHASLLAADVAWKIDGPGAFDGDTSGLASIYLIPAAIFGESALVTISVSLSRAGKILAQDQIRFTLLAPQKPTQPTEATQPETKRMALQDAANGMEMVFIRVPAGQFEMGCGVWADHCRSDERLHSDQVNEFWIGQYEVTRRQWRQVMSEDAAGFKPDDSLPVDRISWSDAQEFLRRLSANNPAYEFRLPNEAEWEYACRSGGKPENYAGSSTPDAVAWYSGTSQRQVQPVGQKAPNGLGIYDMSGNVREWTADWHDADYAFTETGTTKTTRGGGWLNAAQYVRCSNREQYFPDSRKSGLGFRVVLTLKP